MLRKTVLYFAHGTILHNTKKLITCLYIRSWEQNWAELSTYFKYPQEVRTLIYTTNAVEGFHRMLRKYTKTKTIYPTDDAVRKSLAEQSGALPPNPRSFSHRNWAMYVRKNHAEKSTPSFLITQVIVYGVVFAELNLTCRQLDNPDAISGNAYLFNFFGNPEKRVARGVPV